MATRKILKFGGSSVGTPERIRGIVKLVHNRDLAPAGSVVGVVVSAFQGVTDSLIQMAKLAANRDPSCKARFKELERRHLLALDELLPPTERSAAIASVKVMLNELDDLLHGVSLLGECSTRTLDHIMSFGERLSAYIVAQACIAAGHKAHALDARGVVVTNEQFGNALYDSKETYTAIQKYFAECTSLPIITGFIGASPNGVTTTLGRGGSDLTASLFGAALEVDEVEIWTDVDGMLTADPRKVPHAFPIPEVTFEEAMELCHFGAKVIYPPTMRPAIDARIPLVVKNTLNPSAPGTRVVHHSTEHPYPITGISSISSAALLRLQGPGMLGVTGTAARFFGALAQAHINVILITQASSEHTICCAIEPQSIDAARDAVSATFELEIHAGLLEPLHVEDSLSIISVVGDRMRQHPGISGRVFSALGSNGINVVAIAQGSSERNISAVISKTDEGKALNAVHDEFFTARSKAVHLWIVGTGLIGSTLLSQLEQQHHVLRETAGIELILDGVANSRRMKLSSHITQPLAFDISLEDDAGDTAAYDVQRFVSDCLNSNAPNSIFVDCTASDDVPLYYPSLLERNIAVVTPNKRGFSSSLEFYNLLRASAESRRTPLLHETCVGAALPILGTLNDLVRSGDTVISIDAVLSGTLSFIFSSMRTGKSFSEAVLEAKQCGYTEPDPRDDLSGMDVARKVLILARDSGLDLELDDITIAPILPSEVMTGSIDDFLTTLPKLDKSFDDLSAKANAEGNRLFVGATIDCANKTATIGLKAVPDSHPFCSLQGADNIVVFTTKRYKTNPLVIKGPGAGAEVTAAGVFADIIRAAR
jgi:aspartokinase/homoserine dehydrogenase 1